MKRAVFLDRDGVLNVSDVSSGTPKPPTSIDSIVLIEGAKEAISIFKKQGFLPVVVTNQPDVARGNLLLKTAREINNQIGEELGINYFYTCFHDDSDKCTCRKPLPGLLLAAANDLGIKLEHSLMVGDRWKDIQAGQTVGAQCFFVDYSYSEEQPKMPFTRVASLLEVSKMIGAIKDD